MTADRRDRQLRRCREALDQVAADAPTLCERWAAHDLRVHLWTLDRDPIGWPGIVVPALDSTASRRAGHIRRRWSYAELVARLARSKVGWRACPLDRFEGPRHALGEYLVHTQDVVRSNAPDSIWSMIATECRGRDLEPSHSVKPYVDHPGEPDPRQTFLTTVP